MSDNEDARDDRPAKRQKSDPPEPFTAPPEVCAGPPDVVLETCDGVYFFSHIQNLRVTCGLFNSLFDTSVPTGEGSETHEGLPVVRVTESAKALNVVLPFCYNIEELKHYNEDTLEEAFDCAVKYDNARAIRYTEHFIMRRVEDDGVEGPLYFEKAYRLGRTSLLKKLIPFAAEKYDLSRPFELQDGELYVTDPLCLKYLYDHVRAKSGKLFDVLYATAKRDGHGYNVAMLSHCDDVTHIDAGYHQLLAAAWQVVITTLAQQLHAHGLRDTEFPDVRLGSLIGGSTKSSELGKNHDAARLTCVTAYMEAYKGLKDQWEDIVNSKRTFGLSPKAL